MKMKLFICMSRTIKLTGENTKKMEVLFLDKLKLELILKIQLSLTLSIFCLIGLMVKKIHRRENLCLGQKKLRNDITVSRYTVNQRVFQLKSQFCFNLHKKTQIRGLISLVSLKKKLQHSTLTSSTPKYQNNIKYRQIRC